MSNTPPEVPGIAARKIDSRPSDVNDDDPSDGISEYPTLWPYGRRSVHTQRSCASEAHVERRGTFAGAMMNIGMTAMGLGILGLADGFECSGLILGTIFLVTCAVLTDISCVLLVRVASRIKQYSFAALADHFIGYWGVRMVHFNLVCLLFFNTTAAFSVPMKTLTVLIRQELLNNDEAAVNAYEEYPFLSKSGWLVGLAQFGVMMLPMYFTSLAHLEPLSMFAFGCMALAMCILFIAFGATFEAEGKEICLVSRFLPASFFLGNAMVAYTCQFNVLQIYAELKNRKHIVPIIHCSILGMALPLYLLIGISGILMANDLTGPEDNIFDSLGEENQPSWLKTLSKVAKYLIVFMTIARSPLKVIPLRDIIIFELSQIKKFAHWSVHNVAVRLGVSAVVLGMVYLVAVFVPMAIVLSISGAVACTFANFILPGMFSMLDLEMYAVPHAPMRKTMNLFRPRWSHYSRSAKKRYVLALICLVFGAVAMIIALIGLIQYRIIELKSVLEKIKNQKTPKIDQLCAHTPFVLQ